jgi:hypothetical protein
VLNGTCIQTHPALNVVTVITLNGSAVCKISLSRQFVCSECCVLSGRGLCDELITRPDRPWDPPSLLYSGRGVSFLGDKAAGAYPWPPTLSSVGVKERVLRAYLGLKKGYSPSGPSWPVLGWTLLCIGLVSWIGSKARHDCMDGCTLADIASRSAVNVTASFCFTLRLSASLHGQQKQLKTAAEGEPPTLYSYATHNDVSVKDGPHIRRWSHNIIILTVLLQ